MTDFSDGDDQRRQLTTPEDIVRREYERLERLRIQRLAKQVTATTVTLSNEERSKPPHVNISLYSLTLDSPSSFITLPDPPSAAGPRWQIELLFGSGIAPLRIEVAGDVVVGMRRPMSQAPDLDLAPYGGEVKGVSRRHALLRPSRNCLYLIDLRSTNGTRVNAIPVSNSTAVRLQNGDAVTLGVLTFRFKIVATPLEIDATRSAQLIGA